MSTAAPAPGMIVLETSDQEQYTVEKAVAMRSVMLKNMIEGELAAAAGDGVLYWSRERMIARCIASLTVAPHGPASFLRNFSNPASRILQLRAHGNIG